MKGTKDTTNTVTFSLAELKELLIQELGRFRDLHDVNEIQLYIYTQNGKPDHFELVWGSHEDC